MMKEHCCCGRSGARACVFRLLQIDGDGPIDGFNQSEGADTYDTTMMQVKTFTIKLREAAAAMMLQVEVQQQCCWNGCVQQVVVGCSKILSPEC